MTNRPFSTWVRTKPTVGGGGVGIDGHWDHFAAQPHRDLQRMPGDLADRDYRDDDHRCAGRPRNGFGWQPAHIQLFGDVMVVAFDPIKEQHQPGHDQQQQPGTRGEFAGEEHHSRHGGEHRPGPVECGLAHPAAAAF